MALDFHINGVTLDHINKGDWLDEPGDAQALDGVTPLARWRRHTWRADVLTAAEWNILAALEGAKVSITTPDYSDRNAASYVTYYGADFENLSGSHDGPVMTGVSCDFLVRV
jgi:hypothetical protein